MTDFDATFAQADRLEGWLTRDQARALDEMARTASPGETVVEIGSHHGRSTIVLARGLPEGARLVAIDPFPPAWRYGGPDTEAVLRANLASAGVAERVEIRVATSRAVHASWSAEVAAVYIDGKHDVVSLRQDLRWSEHVRPHGWLLVHDAFSSLGVTVGLLSVLPFSRRLRYVGRVGSLARIEVTRPSLRDRLRPLAEMPWWLRNLGVKVLLRLRLRGVARRLGHHDAADPY